MIKLGLIGYPVSHSLSPTIQNAALQACGLDGDYSLFPIAPDDKHGLKALLARVRSGEITGLNVTIPHKQNVIGLLDELTLTAKTVGAVNTIYYRDEKLVGDNTDVMGFLTGLQNLRGGAMTRGESALIFGAGGSARAVVYALAFAGWSLHVYSRRFEQSYSLNSLRQVTVVNTHADITPLLNSIHLIVNTTPLGMLPNTQTSPWPEDLPFPPHAIVYDLVYNPRETKLVKDARAQGLSATTGLGMLIEQAALAFELWTGQNPPREVMLASVDQSPISNL